MRGIYRRGMMLRRFWRRLWYFLKIGEILLTLEIVGYVGYGGVGFDGGGGYGGEDGVVEGEAGRIDCGAIARFEGGIDHGVVDDSNYLRYERGVL
jgi:hypothetical protein